jgi:hypothetical protein
MIRKAVRTQRDQVAYAGSPRSRNPGPQAPGYQSAKLTKARNALRPGFITLHPCSNLVKQKLTGQ